MNLLGIPLLSVVIIYTTVLSPAGVSTACVNSEPDDFCDASLATGDCYFISNRNCLCANSCKLPGCLPETYDTDCMCFSYASYCPGVGSLCPTSCDLRANLTCEPLLVVNHATPSPQPPAYSDQVTYTCDEGYEMVGGESGLRVCIADGVWLEHPVNGTPPVCQPVSCGSPPTLQNFVPSAPVGYYGEQVTYTCPVNTVPMGGGSAKHSCNITGFWEEDPSDTLPDCKDMEIIFRNSKAEMAGVPPPSTSRGRSNIDCARQCAVMDRCHGYTFAAESMACSFNSGTAEPVITNMKKT